MQTSNAASFVDHFENPDHVAIVIHNYRWRQSLADGEGRFDSLEAKLAQRPVISVATITHRE